MSRVDAGVLGRARRAYRDGGLSTLVKRTARATTRALVPYSVYRLKSGDVLDSDDIERKLTRGESLWYLPGTGGPGDHPDVESIVPFGRSLDDETVRARSFEYDAEFVSEFSDVRLLKPYGMAVTADGKILKPSVSGPSQTRETDALYRSFNTHPLVSAETLLTHRRKKRRSIQSVDVACSLYRGYSSFFHWIFVNLPKIRAAEHYVEQTGKRPTFVIPEDPPSYVRDSLSLLGYDREDTVQFTGTAVDVDTLVLPSYPEPTRSNIEWLRRRFWEGVPEREGERGYTRLYLSRRDVSRRNVRNESEVVEALSDLGFDVCVPGRLTFEEQIQTFRDADVVVSPHGGALSNVVWATDTHVVELFNEYVVGPFFAITATIGHEYTALQGDCADPEQTTDSDIVVDVSELETTVKNILQ